METKEKNNRKLMLWLPVLILPFLALAFVALGGGKGVRSDQEQTAKRGINTSLPDASLKNADPQDKLSLYGQINSEHPEDDADINNPNKIEQGVIGTDLSASDHNEKRISEKLAIINQQINRPEPSISPTYSPQIHSNMGGDVDRLEKLMQEMQSGKKEDAEMLQLSGMLDKIIAIQNPELVKKNPQPQKNSGNDSLFKAIPAVIEGNQKVVQGGAVKLRLLDTLRIQGVVIPKGHILYGSGYITNQRLLLNITNIRLENSIVPVDLSIFSLDGMIGINAPEAELSDAASGGADNALQSMQFLSMDQSLGVQAASAGITAAKGLVGKKVRRIKVKLENGKQVLLRNNKLKPN